MKPTQFRFLAYVLLALAALVMLAGLATGNCGDARNRIPLPLRMLSSLLVWFAALLLWRSADLAVRRQAALAAAGMGCGFLGDLIMARVIPLPEHVISGMLTFGAGHGCYIGATAGHLAQRGALKAASAPLLASWLIGAIGWYFVARNPAKSGVLNGAALAYALLLASTSGMGAALAMRDSRYLSLALGGVLFFISDLILAGELFRDLFFPHIGDAIWLTYLTGQGLIVEALGTERARILPSTNAERE
ncbi:lysoplasmalogenase [Roseiflexus sp.]|uniref:lysoplasmalogenase n=1 Tax=Roseiflexus sp. TaxID=2562120 RepID=UPI0021DD6C6A|nr:lysoplasmalogenase [Roseiflexus sp.]GIW01221.1 MAG: hypothetical protein KatS3mg058_2624 [Roseiflexus sp.]